jgi:hypothetical protein
MLASLIKYLRDSFASLQKYNAEGNTHNISSIYWIKIDTNYYLSYLSYLYTLDSQNILDERELVPTK